MGKKKFGSHSREKVQDLNGGGVKRSKSSRKYCREGKEKEAFEGKMSFLHGLDRLKSNVDSLKLGVKVG